ncbi:cytochrome c [Desulfobacterota bacterium AH_259_B03_O07]|nr:cytochrome c [Desulfobacterota bacterium AH_259_B03_O07]
MRKPILISIIIFLLVVGVVLTVTKDIGYSIPTVPTWLTGSTEDKVNNLGRIQPSYADLMLWTGIRLDELYVGGVQGKQEYAKHQAIKIKETLEKAAIVDPRRRTGIEGLLSANYPSLIEAIESGEPEKFKAAFGKLYASCVNCHVIQGVFFLPLIPTTSISPITSGSLEAWQEIQKYIQLEEQKKN